MKNQLLIRALCTVLLGICLPWTTQAAISFLLSAPQESASSATAADALSVQVLFINTGSQSESFELPSQMSAYLESVGTRRAEILMDSGLAKKWVEIPAGSFAARQYRLPADALAALELPARSTLKISLENSSSISLNLAPVADAPTTTEAEPALEHDSSDFITGELGKTDTPLEEGSKKQRSAMVDYFHKHFSGYEPLYFLVGANPSGGLPDMKGAFPNARFQVSLRYTPFTEDSWVADQWSGFTNVLAAYTQNSVWDLEGLSAPFLDTTYKPELQYYWRDILGEEKGILRQMDLLASLAHESNGRSGSASRSINYIIARPTFHFGNPERLNGYLAPGFWFYLGSLTDNPRIRHYRGHADVRAALQWADSLQMASTFQIGDELEKGSMQLDLSYPLGHITGNSLDFYLHVQYFTGYGQTLLYYDRREQALRAGVSFFFR
ncbi:MAG: phospholipase A [Limisphaerales bacterium]|jgi:phospholipase A1|nr:phospholipase A [Verrucomicrobiota bacterium]